MEVTLWGVRGSMANPTQANQFYGANTACVELRLAGGGLLIFDAGTGIRSLSRTLPDSGECHIFISHEHADHVQGLTFFQPFFQPGWIVHLYLPEWLVDLPKRLFDGTSFPVAFSDLKARALVHPVRPGEGFALPGSGGAARIESLAANHPGGCLAYRVRAEGAVFLYSGDHEIAAGPAGAAQADAMLKGAALAVVDAAFTRADYREGWGHSIWEDWVASARRTGAGVLILSHHTQDRTDAELDALQRELFQEQAQGGVTQFVVAREGMNVAFPGLCDVDCKPSDWMQDFIGELSRHKEESVLLDGILDKTRELAHADAGSIYLAEGEELVFAYSHNDTLFPHGGANKSAYVNMRLPMTEASIAGYAALSGQVLNLPDVHDLPPDAPYSFDDTFDKKIGYRTRSMVTIPFIGRSMKVLGVLQLINSLHPRTGAVQPFSPVMKNTVQLLAREAATFLEASNQVRDSINRLLRIAMLHDPFETGPHAERVGAIAAEVYHHWALKKNEPPERLRWYKGQIRLAAMLHDIGKVGVSDLILKKPGKLTDEEFTVMQQHTVLGSELFTADARDITEMAHEISLHHHQKWSGQGYPRPQEGAPLAGEAIPLSARITAIADVFDALVSPRCYKDPWTTDRAAAFLADEAGKHFDPELVECFLEIMDTVALIYERYPETKNAG